jgi:hypothetical protein
MDRMCIVRLLDANRQVLGWTKIPCYTRGDGGIWARQAFVFEAEMAGIGTHVHYHEPDQNIWLQMPVPEPMPVDAGKVYSIALSNALFQITSNPEHVPPAVTVRTNVTISPDPVHA